ncbi:hypothetical protein EV44_g0438 [Erysiphe necator]|uniref:Uncharacterized protein n=1 Tax=Uncinula necator TaxID=52586 RepID=A0A0B1P3L3_UNCNE|nr:hypothetical protein EV44_g0438 [Erysiphe necator]
MFFQSWQLWEKMSFILGVALITVFIFGWAKLAWKIRIMKKQEIMDEEKRARRQELRASNQRGETIGKHDIPFGIRAIQSGIQIDGIWISNPNTPVPSELTLSSVLGGESSDDMSKSSVKPLSKVKSQLRQKSSICARPESFGCYHAKNETLQDILEGKATRISYKPRRSSHLRYEGQGDGAGDALHHIQGTPFSRNRTISPRSRRYNPADQDPDSSAADNERNSGTSDESDATLSLEPPANADRSVRLTLNVTSDDNTEKTLLSDSPPLSREFLANIHDPKTDLSVPDKDTLNDDVPCFLQPEIIENREVSPSPSETETQKSLSPTPFKPGELHMNKISRKVNTGFEVLPAGTFGIPVEFKANTSDHKKKQEATDKRPPAKLQKKPPDSVSYRSGTSEV